MKTDATQEKLNLGCGNDIRDGYINLDIAELDGVDIVHDLNQLPLPIDSESLTKILCLDVFEHVDYVPLLKECHRILKPGGTVVLEVPHFSSNNNFVDPTHLNRFSVKTFNFFVEGTSERRKRNYYFNFSFSEISQRELIFIRKLTFFWNWPIQWIVNRNWRIQQYFEATGLTYIFPAQNLRISLRK